MVATAWVSSLTMTLWSMPEKELLLRPQMGG
jgi:hypothetical protein